MKNDDKREPSGMDRSTINAFAIASQVGLGIVLPPVAGALIGERIRDTSAFGLDAMFPAVILALILPKLSDRKTRNAAVAGVAIALATTPFLPAGLPVLLALAAVVLAR